MHTQIPGDCVGLAHDKVLLEVMTRVTQNEPSQGRQSQARFQTKFDECIGLIWSDRVNSAQLCGCSCRCLCLFPKTERAAVGAVLSDD